MIIQSGGGEAEENEERGVDVSSGKYGNYGMIQSEGNAEQLARQFMHVCDLGTEKADQTVWVRGRLHTSRAKGIMFRLFHSDFHSTEEMQTATVFSLFQENNVLLC